LLQIKQINPHAKLIFNYSQLIVHEEDRQKENAIHGAVQ